MGLVSKILWLNIPECINEMRVLSKRFKVKYFQQNKIEIKSYLRLYLIKIDFKVVCCSVSSFAGDLDAGPIVEVINIDTRTKRLVRKLRLFRELCYTNEMDDPSNGILRISVLDRSLNMTKHR